MKRGSIAILVLTLILILAISSSALADRHGSLANNKDATWSAHLSSDSGLQGELWLQETPCELGTYFSLRSPQLGRPAYAKFYIGNDLICTVPSNTMDGMFDAYRMCFMLEAWPDDPTEYPADPGEGVVWFKLSISADQYFAALRTGDVTVRVVDGEDTVYLEGAVR